MSGHSKWHNIQKTKGAADAKRSATFTKIAKEIIVAVKQGGSGDPANNSRLATVVAKAKAANMPNDNIKRTIDKALGSGNTDNYESVTYEGYGPCGVAVIVEALTDNRQRTAPEIRHYFDKFGKGMGAQGCVSWSFDRKGVIVIDNEEGELDEDTVMMDALEAGAADFEADGPALEITCDPDAFNDVVKALEGKEINLVCFTGDYQSPLAQAADTAFIIHDPQKFDDDIYWSNPFFGYCILGFERLLKMWFTSLRSNS